MRRFLRGLVIKYDSRVDEEYNEENKAKESYENLIQCIRSGKNTKDMIDDVIRCLEQKTDVNIADEVGFTPLHDAVYYGLDDIVEMLLDTNADVNAKDIYGWTPLHEAISRGDTNIVALLLRSNADLNATNENGDTVLHMAAWKGKEDIGKLLLKKNDNINARGLFGWTPLHVAMANEKTNIVRLFLSKHADANVMGEDGYTPLMKAVLLGNKDIVKVLLNNNVNVNLSGRFGWTPLFIAVLTGETNIVRLLLKKRADVNVTYDNGDTLLIQAVSQGKKDIVKLLLNKNANVNTRNKFGRTPLHVAVFEGKTNIVRLLLNKNADVNATGEDGHTPLLLAVYWRKKDIVRLLLKKNANVNVRAILGQTPLYVAVIRAETDILTLLLSRHADVNATDKNGDTPLHEAVFQRKNDIVKLLLNENPDVDARGKFGRTPFYIAVNRGETNILTLLLSKRADVNLADENGDTPLHVAANLGKEDIVKLLLDKNAVMDVRGKFQRTPLLNAVIKGKTNAVRLLLSKHADVNATDENGNTALHVAARCGYEDIVKLLLTKNANVSLRCKLGKSPLHGAIRAKNMRIVKLLLGKTAVNTLDGFGNTSLQINSGANINAKDSAGNTPLHEAARLVATDIAALLVRYGADVTLKNNAGHTPLCLHQLFAFEDNAKIVQLLQIAEINSAQMHYDEVQSNNPNTLSYNNSHKIPKTISLKTIDDFGFSGQLYETKMISLFYLRMLNSKRLEQDLLLGVNINDIGDMDDICLRYRVRDQQRPVVLFIQGKHKKSPKSKLTNIDLWSGFDLRKYFKSYLKILEKFQIDHEDPMFQGNFEDIDCYFILYTSAQESLGTKKKTKNKVNLIIHELINTSESTEPFQYNYNEADTDNLLKAVNVNDYTLNLTSKNCYKTHAKIFFSKLWIFPSQANETKVERIVKKEINKYYNDNGDANNVSLKQYSDAIFLIIHHNIQEWWRLKNKAPYLTRSNDFFKLAKLIFLADVLLILCNAVNYLTNEVQFQFNKFFHVTTASMEDLHIFLRELLRTITSLKLNSNDTDFDLLSLDFLLTDKRLERETMMLDSEKSEYILNVLNIIPEVISSNDFEKFTEFKYVKRRGTSEVGGVLLKMKMSSLIFLRALNHAQIDHNTVLLRAKIPGISMTDICLRFNLKDQQRIKMLFMQLIYRENPEKRKLTPETLWRNSENCCLLKYFSSYLELKERFRKSNEDHMFEGGYQNVDCNFILCTSVEESFTPKKITYNVSREIMDLINTGDNPDVFQIAHNDADIDRLVKMATNDQLYKLGNVFLKYLITEKYNINLLSNKLIEKYHVVMAQDVIQPCEQPMINQYRMWKFRSDFFDSNLEHLITLKESFFKTLPTKCHNRSNNDLQLLTVKLPLAFGNLDMTFRSNKNQTNRIKWVANKLMYLLELNEDTKIVEINDDDVGPDKMLQQGFIDVNGGIGSAVGNLLIFDTDTKTLKFNLDQKSLPYNANLFLKELKDSKYNPYNKDLSVYRIKINIDNFPKSSFYDDGNDKRQVRDFLRKFWIYPIQAKEDEIERIFKYEINKLVSENKSYHKNGNISDLIPLLCLNEMQKWSLLPNESPYLTRASELFERAELSYIYNLLQSVVNFMYMSGTHSIDIKVEQTSDEYEQYKKKKQLFKKISSKLLNILDPQQLDQSIKLECPRSSQYKKSRLTLNIHPKMESLLLIFSAEFANNFKYRAFAIAGFVYQGSNGKINKAEGKFMIYEQDFLRSDVYDSKRLY